MVAVTTYMPSRKAKACTGSMAKVKGSISARLTEPPRPGRMPTAKPIAMPASIVTKTVGSKMPSRLLKKVSSMR